MTGELGESFGEIFEFGVKLREEQINFAVQGSQSILL
jgi:hypothetical protein